MVHRRGPAGPPARAWHAAVAVAVLLVAACSPTAPSPVTSPAGGSPAASAGSTSGSAVTGPQVGERAPDLSLLDLDGKPVSLTDYRGRPVVLNYWASWCGPCRDEFPALKAAEGSHAAEGLAVLGVLFKDDVAPARDFMAREGATWTSLADPDGVGETAFRVVAPPTTFFIDRKGIVRDLQVGAMTPDQLDRHLETILR